MNSIGAAAQLAAAKVKGNGLQSVRAQFVRVQDFKDGAETDVRVGGRSIVVAPVAGRTVPANRTARRAARRNILSPRKHSITVLDISAVLVQHRVPFVALGNAAFGIARTCIVTSHRRCAQGIVHAADIVLAENQICGIQGIPAYRMRYGIVRHKQAVVVRLYRIISAHTFRVAGIGVHRSGISKGNIVQGAVRQIAVHRAGNARAGEVKIIGAAGFEGKLLVRRIISQ